MFSNFKITKGTQNQSIRYLPKFKVGQNQKKQISMET